MQIKIELLLSSGGVVKRYLKDSYIFSEGDQSRFYFQIIEGKVRMCSQNEDGKEFVQGIFGPGDSFGEPPLFINEKYPASAVADRDCVIVKLLKENLFKILNDSPEIERRFLVTFSQRIFNKAITSRGIINQNPTHRIKSFLENYKKEKGDLDHLILIPYTRQEIANFTGLRVETVIRTIKKMESENQVKILKRKLYY
jgi:CRP/FNR family transcriptional regulator